MRRSGFDGEKLEIGILNSFERRWRVPPTGSAVLLKAFSARFLNYSSHIRRWCCGVYTYIAGNRVRSDNLIYGVGPERERKRGRDKCNPTKGMGRCESGVITKDVK